MVAAEAPVMVNLRCRKCNKVLMKVLREHMAAVQERIQIKCFRCGEIQ